MSDTKTLQAILDNIATLRNEVKKGFDSVGKEIKENSSRIDKLGAQLAYLEDDAPTTKEFEKLKRKVEKLEVKVASIQESL